MERSHLFEAVLLVLIISLIGLLGFMVMSTQPADSGWERTGNGSVDYMFVGSNDTLYMFSGNHIAAIRSDGSPAWALDVPGEWRVLNNWMVSLYSWGDEDYGRNYRGIPAVDEQFGYLYLFITRPVSRADVDLAESNESLRNIDAASKLLAIAPSGDVVWEFNFTIAYRAESIRGMVNPDYAYIEGVTVIKATGDRVYLFHDSDEAVLGTDGKLLVALHNLSAPVSVDEMGRMYAIGMRPVDRNTFLEMTKNTSYVGGPGLFFWDDSFSLPSDVVSAYGPDGSLLWSHSIGESAIHAPVEAYLWPEYNALPLYVNGTLYVPLTNGVAALDPEGNLKWVRHITGGIFSLYQMMPADSHGNVYMEDLSVGSYDDETIVYAITPEGNVSADVWHVTESGYRAGLYLADHQMPVAGKDGVVYAIDAYPAITAEVFDNAFHNLEYPANTIRAIDPGSNRILWNFTVPRADRHALVLNESNIDDAIQTGDMYDSRRLPQVRNDIQVYPGNGVTYVSYDFAICDYPIVYNQSRCYYARGLYALDNEGKLLWEAHPKGFVDRVAAGNGTIYYFTTDGRMGGTTVSIVAGMAFAALAYLFLRFFMVGTVARARSRLKQNENRNRVLQYVVDHPGLTVTDMVRGTGMNKGTVRYHLFILTLNHKVVTHREDDKYLRYFRNSWTYTEAERTLLSLLRREPLRRTLGVLAEKPGLSGSALARELGISPTAANRHISILAEKGIVEQVPGSDRGYGYTIKDEHRERVCRAMELLGQRD